MDLSVQYATSANLSARIELHQRFSTNPYGLQRWVFDRLQLAPGMRVLEIACGAGSLWRENLDRIPRGLELVLSDFSIGMVQTTRAVMPGAAFVTCALPQLPFAAAQFDLVIANHMLYHVDDRQRAFTEIRRVLRRDGALFATTNGVDHLREIKQLIRELGAPDDVSAAFTLENAEEQLRAVFSTIERDQYVDSLRITDADVLVRYLASVTLRAGEMRSRIERRIASDGAFHVMKSTGSFIARNG
jgi:ubiquinone/menaquinone biosynthesis C-methylase UbiE